MLQRVDKDKNKTRAGHPCRCVLVLVLVALRCGSVAWRWVACLRGLRQRYLGGVLCVPRGVQSAGYSTARCPASGQPKRVQREE